jgi:solute carrier family 13 (sodium-dependent dicarboxylate transporter), member 2/3/5
MDTPLIDRSLPAGEPRGPIAWAGLLAAPLAACATYVLLTWGTELPHVARATAAITVLMGLLWVTEALPLAATALLPLVLFPLAGVLPFAQAAAPYANSNIYIYLGGFIIALAIERWGLHRRLALRTLLLVGTSPQRLIGGMMLATALLSMGISNTATTAMMLPLGLSLIALTQGTSTTRPPLPAEETSRFATSMLLGIAYAATIGGVGTLIGTPTNVVLAGFLTSKDLTIGFARWMVFALPLVALYLLLAWQLLTGWLFRVPARDLAEGPAILRRELDKLGPMTRGERAVLIVALGTALLWMVREPLQNAPWTQARFPEIGKYVNDGLIALLGALALFAIPIDLRRGLFAMDWETCKRLPWGVLLLFGGGLSLAEAVERSMLASAIGESVTAWGGFSILLLVIVVTATVLMASEFTSNVATVATFLPIMFGVSEGLRADPRLLLVATTVAASCAFMLPVGTPPNAIVFGSGHIRQRDMIRAGIGLNLVGIVLVPLVIYTLGVWVLGIRLGEFPY